MHSDALCVALSGILQFALVVGQHFPVEIKNSWSILSSLVELAEELAPLGEVELVLAWIERLWSAN
jgi:hypothetical protein